MSVTLNEYRCYKTNEHRMRWNELQFCPPPPKFKIVSFFVSFFSFFFFSSRQDQAEPRRDWPPRGDAASWLVSRERRRRRKEGGGGGLAVHGARQGGRWPLTFGKNSLVTLLWLILKKGNAWSFIFYLLEKRNFSSPFDFWEKSSMTLWLILKKEN